MKIDLKLEDFIWVELSSTLVQSQTWTIEKICLWQLKPK